MLARALFVLLLLSALGEAAVAAERWPQSAASSMAHRAKDRPALIAAIRVELAQCERARPVADECFNQLRGLSFFLREAGDPVAAEPFARRAVAIAERVPAVTPKERGFVFHELARNLDAQFKHGLAEPFHLASIRIFRILPVSEAANLSGMLDNYGKNLHRQDRFAEADAMLREGLAMRERYLPPGHPDIALSANNVASNLDRMRRYALAEPFYRKAIATYEAARPYSAFSVGIGYNNLATNLSYQERYAAAETAARRAIQVFEQGEGATSRNLAMALGNLGSILNTQLRYREAEPYYRRALEIYRARVGARDERLALGYSNLAITLHGQRRYAEAESMFRAAFAIRNRDGCKSGRGFASYALGRHLFERGERTPEVRTLYAMATQCLLGMLSARSGYGEVEAADLRSGRSMFVGQIRVAWALTEKERR